MKEQFKKSKLEIFNDIEFSIVKNAFLMLKLPKFKDSKRIKLLTAISRASNQNPIYYSIIRCYLHSCRYITIFKSIIFNQNILRNDRENRILIQSISDIFKIVILDIYKKISHILLLYLK